MAWTPKLWTVFVVPATGSSASKRSDGGYSILTGREGHRFTPTTENDDEGIAVSGKRKKENKPRRPARFTRGAQVRVKPGTTVPDFEDISLGGWAGTIRDVDQTS